MAYNVEKVQPYQTEASKREQVEAMFNRIAPNYDKLNRLLSLGIDNYWRRESIGALKPYHPRLILDVATGTGDFAILANEILDPERIVGIDISDGMMAVGREKVKRKGMEQTITLRTAGFCRPLLSRSIVRCSNRRLRRPQLREYR